MKKIHRLKAAKIAWPDDWEEDEVWAITVDGTHCWINEPQHPEWSQDRKYYSHKYNKAGICYELALDIRTSRLVWMNGPFRAGTNDSRIFPNHGLMAKLEAFGKKAIGDKVYSGKKYQHVMSTCNAHDDYCVKKFKSRALTRQENFKNMTSSNLAFRLCMHPFAPACTWMLIVQPRCSY
jgi:DDE superfamily endonuclease